MTPSTIRGQVEFVRDLARRLSRGRIDHEELAQDAIERWLRAIPALPPATNHEAWLTTVIKNLFVDCLRRRDARAEHAADCTRLPDTERDVPPWWLELGLVDVDRELAKLSSGQRATFRSFAFEGKSYDEIAQEQGIAKATVGTRISRARLRIKQLLEAQRGPAAPADFTATRAGTARSSDRAGARASTPRRSRRGARPCA
jgi:RNA polymerase sigma-70 factor, ECF subfamily